MKRKLLSMLLALCMVFTLFPTSAFATGNVSIGTSSVTNSGTPAVCEHTTHDEACGYVKAVEGADCTHLNEDGTYSCGQTVSGNEATPSDADKETVCDHSDNCGYIEAVEGADCTHECELCKPAEVEKPAKPEVTECDCTVKCTAADAENEVEAAINADCPVCGIEGADLAACKGEKPAPLTALRSTNTEYSFTFVNNTGIDATALYTTSTSQDDWGTTLGTVNNNASHTATVAIPSTDTAIDVKLSYGSGDFYEFDSIDISKAPPSGGTITLTIDTTTPKATTSWQNDTPNGEKITTALDFTANVADSDCTSYAGSGYVKHTHSKAADKCWTWENADTLTLNNLNLETTDKIAIKLPADAKVVMNGDSTVKSKYNSSNSTYGIYGVGALTFSGSGSLTATGGTSTRDSYGAYVDSGNITVESGTLTATGGMSTSSSYGAYAGTIAVSGTGTLTANGGTATNNNSYGAYAFGSSSITVSGTGSLTATGGQAGYNSGGVFAAVGITVSDTGTLTATGGTSTGANGSSYGAKASGGDITVSGGTFEAKTIDTTGTAQAVNTAPVTSGYTPSPAKLSAGTTVDSLGVVNDLSAFTTYKHIKIEQGTASETDNGAKITTALDFTTTPPADCTKLSTGAHTHTNEADKCFTWGKVDEVDTLTLNNLHLETSAETAIKLPTDATVNMGAEGSINTVTSGDSSTDATYGIYGMGALTFEGSGSLNATGGKATSAIGVSCGVYAKSGDITVSDTGTLNATGGASTRNNSYGVLVEAGNVVVSGTGTLNATGGKVDTYCSYGVFVTAGITVSGGTFEAKSISTGGMKVQAVNGSPGTTGYANVKLSAGTAVDNLSVVSDLSAYATYKHIKIEQGTASETDNGAKITTALDFTTTPPADCTKLSTGAHTHTNEADKCFTWGKVDGVGTLTLNNLHLETASAATAIKLPAGSTVNMGAAGSNSTVKSTDGVFEDTYGIYGAGALTFSGSGSLTATGGTATSGNSCGVYARDAITVSGTGTLSAMGGQAGSDSYGVYVFFSAITVSGTGTLNGTGGTTKSGDSYGVYADEGNITVSGTLTATGGQANSSSYGIYANGNITASGTGTLTATGGQASYNSYGVYTNGGNITVSGGTFEAKTTDTDGTAQAVSKAPDTSGYTPSPVKLSAGTAVDSLSVVNDLSAFATYKHIKIEQDTTTPENTPNAAFYAAGTNSGTLSGLAAGASYKYSIDGGSTYTDFTGATATIASGITTTNGIKVVKKGNGTTTSDSAAQTIAVTQAATPTGLGKTDETSTGNDGTITGVTTAMEYKLSTALSWTGIAGTSITGLSAGTYHVRVKASGTALASTDASVTIAAFAKETPTTADLNYDLSAVDYDGNAKPLSVTKKTAGIGDITVKYGALLSTDIPIDAGSYDVTVDIAANAEYNAASLKLTSTFNLYTINKAAYSGTKVASTTVRSGEATTNATLTLPTLPTGASYATTGTAGGTTAALINGTPAISGKTLTFSTANQAADISATITINVTGATNYENYSVVVTVTAKAKESVTITGTAATSLTYNGSAQNGYTAVTVDGNKIPVNELVYTYSGRNSTIYSSTAAPTNAGDYSLVVSVAGSNATYMGQSAPINFTIAKKEVTVKADDKTITVNDTLPTFTVSYTGFVGTENANNAALTTPAEATCTADGKTAGSFDINLTTQAALNATVGKNYTLGAQTKGTLTVSAASIDRSALDTAIAAANSAKTGISVNDNAASSVASGTRFVSNAVMNALNAAIATATGATINSAADVTVAADTLNASITTFKAAIQTGTYSSGGGGGNGGGGGSSSSGGSNITVITPPADKPNLPTQGEIKVDAKVEGGNATINITDKNVTDAYNKALADAKKNGNEANGITLALNVSTGNKTVNSATVNLPKTAQETIISRKIVNTVVVVNNPDIKIGMDLTAVTEINKQANADVNITTTRMDGSKLTDSAKTAIGSRPVFDLAVSYGGGKAISSFGAGNVSVSIPYALQAGEKAGNVQAVYVDANGKVQWLSSSVYDSVNQVVLFGTSHFSTYGVGYKQDAPAFTDSTNHWAKDDIQFVVNRGLFAGTSATTFSPDTAMTRGMFVTALGRLANADVSSYKQSSFPDVKADSYYMGYIEWASKNGILSGGMDGKFNPDASITREQMAVIMTGYAKAIGFTTPKVHAENTFADSAKISVYAKTAVKQMQMAGVLAGKNSNIFDPQGIATRAEASAILRRFVELAISSDACQGWTMNDSGQWMYYENGKPVTGKKDIGGASYTFDQYGVTA